MWYKESEINFHFIWYLWNSLCVLYPLTKGSGIWKTTCFINTRWNENSFPILYLSFNVLLPLHGLYCTDTECFAIVICALLYRYGMFCYRYMCFTVQIRNALLPLHVLFCIDTESRGRKMYPVTSRRSWMCWPTISSSTCSSPPTWRAYSCPRKMTTPSSWNQNAR